MKFSLCYTSRRAHAIAQIVQLWLTRASRPEDVEIILSTDADYPEGEKAAGPLHEMCLRRELRCAEFTWKLNQGPSTCVSGWNTAAALATGDVLIAITDDFLPPEKWDDALRDVAPGSWWEEDRVVWVADGYNPDIFTLSILTRRRYQRFGYLFYPGYASLFCLPPETLIWVGDLGFKPIAEVQKGDTVVGSVRRFGKGNKQKRNFLSPVLVVDKKSRISRLVKVTLASGRTLRCTPDHLWAYYGDGRLSQRRFNQTHAERIANGSGCAKVEKCGPIKYEGGYLWGEARPGIGRKLVHVVDPIRSNVLPGSLEEATELGWLAGMMDGDGCFPVFSQSATQNPEICAEISRLLTKFGFGFSADNYLSSYSKITGRQHVQRTFTLTGGKHEYLRFLNTVRPLKRKSKQALDRLMRARFGEADSIVSVEDDGVGEVMCLSTESGNYVAGGYLSHNCDTEYTAVAKLEPGSVIDARHLLFEHLHPDCGKRQRDPLDLTHASKERWRQGEMLFNFRRDSGFPVDQGPVADRLEASYQDLKFAVYVQAIRDDFCLAEVIERLLDDANGGSKVAGPITSVWICAPDEYWGGKAQTPEEMAELVDISGYLSAKYQQVCFRLMPQPVAPHRVEGRSRIMVETVVRNAAIDRIRSTGHDHVIIADGDELWQPGLFQRLVQFVQEFRPHSVYTGMIPVIGLPGYPIEGATDKATIYIGPGAWFVDCRGVSGHRHELPSNDVIHFTATRRTREEIAQKMLESGHADDPSYDFKAWNEHVLPNIRPGFRHRFSPTSVGLHMWLPQNVWPACRAWRPEEWATLPNSVKKYLAPPV